MTKKEKLALLKQWQLNLKTVYMFEYQIAKAFGVGHIDAFECVYKLADSYTKLVSEKVGDQGAWLDWYANDNGFGAQGLEASSETNPDKFIKIKTLEDLLEVIG